MADEASAAARPGIRTSELWGKVIIQAILVLNAIFNLGIQVDDELALGIAGLMESAYSISRAMSKRPTAGVEMEKLAMAIATALATQERSINVAVSRPTTVAPQKTQPPQA